MNHEQPTPQIPEYAPPEPSRLQRLSMGAATRLLGAGENDPLVGVEKLVTDVGGYEQKVKLHQDSITPSEYVHREARQIVTVAAQDETTKQGHKLAYKNGSDFSDANGTHLDSAFNATINKRRASGDKATTLRGRVARSLMKHATKGVGLQAYANKKTGR